MADQSLWLEAPQHTGQRQRNLAGRANATRRTSDNEPQPRTGKGYADLEQRYYAIGHSHVTQRVQSVGLVALVRGRGLGSKPEPHAQKRRADGKQLLLLCGGARIGTPRPLTRATKKHIQKQLNRQADHQSKEPVHDEKPRDTAEYEP